LEGLYSTHNCRWGLQLLLEIDRRQLCPVAGD
jgi:hypothetical protein